MPTPLSYLAEIDTNHHVGRPYASSWDMALARALVTNSSRMLCGGRSRGASFRWGPYRFIPAWGSKGATNAYITK
jgi:hypothetical protein